MHLAEGGAEGAREDLEPVQVTLEFGDLDGKLGGASIEGREVSLQLLVPGREAISELFAPIIEGFSPGNDPCAAVRNPTQAQKDFCVQQGVPASEIPTSKSRGKATRYDRKSSVAKGEYIAQ